MMRDKKTSIINPHKFASSATTTCTGDILTSKNVLSPSPESFDVTLSLSPISTNNRENVSWSSSEGSTYYSPYSDRQSCAAIIAASLIQTNENNNINTTKSESRTLMKPVVAKTQTESSLAVAMATAAAVDMKFKPKKSTKLKDVDVFTEIEIATSNEDLSTVRFLTTEETKEAFCTRIVPFEVKMSKNTDVICSESIQECAINDNNLIYAIGDAISINSQETVSSLEESVSTLDNISLESDGICANESYKGADDHIIYSTTTEEFRHQNAKQKSAIRERSQNSSNSGSKVLKPAKTAMSLRIDSKVKKIKIKLQQKEQSDLNMDQRIKELKEKIRSVQQEATYLDDNLTSEGYEENNEGDDEVRYCNTDTTSPLINKFDSHNMIAMVSKESRNTKIRQGSRQEKPATSNQVPLMIPVVVDKENISVMEFNVLTNTSNDNECDVEYGQPSCQHSIEGCTQISDPAASSASYNGKKRNTIDIIFKQTRIAAANESTVPYLIQKRNELAAKPRDEKIVIVAMVALTFIFFILLIISIMQ